MKPRHFKHLSTSLKHETRELKINVMNWEQVEQLVWYWFVRLFAYVIQ